MFSDSLLMVMVLLSNLLAVSVFDIIPDPVAVVTSGMAAQVSVLPFLESPLFSILSSVFLWRGTVLYHWTAQPMPCCETCGYWWHFTALQDFSFLRQGLAL